MGAVPQRRWWRRRGVLATAAVVAVAGVVFVLVWFEPQAVFLDDRVDEAFPGAAAGATEDPPAPEDAPAPEDTAESASSVADAPPPSDDAPPPAGPDEASSPAEGVAPPEGPVELASGDFVGRSRYNASGTATVYEVDGRRVLRFEGFEADNGPDLVVWLARAGGAAPDEELEADFVDLGELTGNIGDQNYELPDDVDVDEYGSVVIWCRRFAVGFATADLTAA